MRTIQDQVMTKVKSYTMQLSVNVQLQCDTIPRSKNDISAFLHVEC
jgi:hypothetical protein